MRGAAKQIVLPFATGAVAVRMRLHDSGLAFVCTHMSSGEAEGDDQKRNYDYAEIVRRLQFPPDVEGASDADALLGISTSGINKVSCTVAGSIESGVAEAHVQTDLLEYLSGLPPLYAT